MTTDSRIDPEPPPATPEQPRGGLWRNPDFMRFWIGETVSLFGVQVTALALPLTAVYVLQAGPEELGGLRFAQFIPFLFLGLLFGALVDRRRKRPLMIFANIARSILIGLVPLLAWNDMLSMPLLFGIALVIGVFTVLFDVCWMSYVPVLVDRNHLMDANGKVSSSYSAAELAGPGAAGLLVQVLTAPFALVADAFSYVISVFMLAGIKREEPLPAPSDQKRNIGSEIVEGLAFVLKHKYLRMIAALGASYNFCHMFIEALFILFAIQVLDFGPGLIGLVLALSAIGGLLGAMFAASLTKRLPFGFVYLMAVIIGFCSPIVVALATGPTAVAATMVVAGFMLERFGLAVANITAISLRQAVTPQRLMGRMTAGMRTLMYGLGTIGALVGGILGGLLGLRTALIIAAIAMAVAAVPLFFSSIPRLRTLPDAVD